MPSSSEGGSDAQKHDTPSIFHGRRRRDTAEESADSHGDVPSHLPSFPARKFSGSSFSTTRDNPMSPDAGDRVFPIRSVVSVNPTPQPQRDRPEGYFGQPRRPSSRQGSLPSASPSEVPGPTSIANFEDAIKDNPELQRRIKEQFSNQPQSPGAVERRQSAFNPAGRGVLQNSGIGYQIGAGGRSDVSGSSKQAQGDSRPSSVAPSNLSGRAADDIGGLVTSRFKHVVTEEGHAVITGRDGEKLQRCEDEPIHIPGAIQSFGVLVAFQEEAEGKLLVRVVSENSKRVLGYSPKELFALESFTDILSEDQTDNLLDHIDFIKDEEVDVQANGPEVFTVSIRNPSRKTHRLWCAIHASRANNNMIICEFELEDDHDYPLVDNSKTSPEPAEDTLNSQPTEEELRESTEKHNKPLRVLRGARKRKGEAAAMEVFNIMSQVQEQLGEAPNLDIFLKVLVGVAKELTGFHRVMIYQFDQNFNGKVVTELVDTRATKDLYKGLHFPASDIPAQARNLYKINKVRLLYDRDHETSRLVCRTVEDLENPLDLTHSFLRAMSPIHIKYLANMAVRSSMSISINAFNELWGLISCHTYGGKGTRVSFPIRKMCRLIGDSASRNIERLSYASRLQARKLINTAPTSKNPSGYIIASSDDLLNLFDAEFGLLSIHDETKILGKLEGTQEALALLEYFRMRKITSVTMSQELRADFPDLRYPPGFQVIAGILLVPLSVGGNDFIVFFRKGQLREVKWAGNPYEKTIREGTDAYLEPRKSFRTWTETIVGRCREWSEEQIETAGVLCLVYGKFIEVWRQKEQALQNTQLTKLLLQNSAHEVRTPLNAIINYLEIALEGAIDQETRDNLAKSHSASKSLIYVINDLLDLTKTEEDNQLILDEAFDPRDMFREAVNMFGGEAKRKGLEFHTVIEPQLPEKVLGDPRRVRQAVSNIVANAIEATSAGSVKASIAVVARYEHTVDVEIVVEDTGRGMSSVDMDKLFVELEQAQAETASVIEDAFSPKAKSISGSDEKQAQRILGLGLAVVARIVNNMSGQMRLKSEVGKGSRFAIVFPFEIPRQEKSTSRPKLERDEGSGSSHTEVPENHGVRPGELLLVAKPTPRQDEHVSTPSRQSLSRKNSGGSARSFNSFRSVASGNSGRSDADRLIEAIQQPQNLERPTSAMSNPTRRPSAEKNRPKHAHFEKRPKSVELAPNYPEHIRVSQDPVAGEQVIRDSVSSLKAVRMPDETTDTETSGSRRMSEVGRPEEILPQAPPSLTAEHLRILVAEDDPINSRIIQKRLQKSGHEPILTVNGEECASQYCQKPGAFDLILMDMQMPIIDGATSAKMIRTHENSCSFDILSSRAALNRRVPIFAVSASLVEKDWPQYVQNGFDGWILKPILFDRLNELIKGLVDPITRVENVYGPGRWEKGGWFFSDTKEAVEATVVGDEIDSTPSTQVPSRESRTERSSPVPLSAPSQEESPEVTSAGAETSTRISDFAAGAPKPT